MHDHSRESQDELTLVDVLCSFLITLEFIPLRSHEETYSLLEGMSVVMKRGHVHVERCEDGLNQLHLHLGNKEESRHDNSVSTLAQFISFQLLVRNVEGTWLGFVLVDLRRVWALMLFNHRK